MPVGVGCGVGGGLCSRHQNSRWWHFLKYTDIAVNRSFSLSRNKKKIGNRPVEQTQENEIVED